MERLKTNNKLTKKGKKNRAKLLAVCKRLSAAKPVIGSQKTKLRKPKKQPKRRTKNEESRKLNRRFQLDPGTTRKYFKKMKASKECVGRLRKRVSSYVIKESVSEPRKDEFTLESTSTRKVIKKKNWRDAGPDKIANFW